MTPRGGVKPAEYAHYNTRGELARLLGVHSANITRWVKQGRIPGPCVELNMGGSTPWKMWCPEHTGVVLRWWANKVTPVR